jgi:hypothetical protein
MPSLADIYFPNRKSLSSLYFPDEKHIPPDAQVRAIGFQFLNIAPLATGYRSIQVTPAFLAWCLLGVDTLGAFGLQLWHYTPSAQRQLFSTTVNSNVGAGSAQLPLPLMEPELFSNGDSIRCQIKNLSTTTTDSIWVALWGGDVSVGG